MGKNQPVLRLNQNGGFGGGFSKLHTATKQEQQQLFPDSHLASLGDETATGQLLSSCDFEEFALTDMAELLGSNDEWSDPHAPLESLLADSLAAGLDSSSTYDSNSHDHRSPNTYPTSSSGGTTVSTMGKECVSSRNSELPEVSTQQPRLTASSRPSLRGAGSSASHSPVPDTAQTFLSLYEETRAAYLKVLRRLYEFLRNSYKSAGKTPNADGEAKMKELRSLIEYLTPKRNELLDCQLTPEGLQQLRHMRDVARAYVQFYRNMKPPSSSSTSSKPQRDQARRPTPPQPAPLSLRSQPTPPPLHAPPSPLPSTPGPHPFSQHPPRNLRVLTPSKRERPTSPPTQQPFPAAPQPPSHPHPSAPQRHHYPHPATTSHSHTRSPAPAAATAHRSAPLADRTRHLHTTPHPRTAPFSPHLSDSDFSIARDSPTVSALSDNLASSSSLRLDAMTLQEFQSHRRQQHSLDLMGGHHMHDQAASTSAPYFNPHQHPHPSLGLRPAAATPSRNPSLQLPLGSDTGSSHSGLSKRAMLQTVAAVSHMEPPGMVPRLHPMQRGGGGMQRGRQDALKTTPVLGYGGGPPHMGMEELLAMQQMGMLGDEAGLLQELGSKGPTLDDLDLLGIPGMVPGTTGDMTGWPTDLLDDSFQLPVQNPGPW